MRHDLSSLAAHRNRSLACMESGREESKHLVGIGEGGPLLELKIGQHSAQ